MRLFSKGRMQHAPLLLAQVAVGASGATGSAARRPENPVLFITLSLHSALRAQPGPLGLGRAAGSAGPDAQWRLVAPLVPIRAAMRRKRRERRAA